MLAGRLKRKSFVLFALRSFELCPALGKVAQTCLHSRKAEVTGSIGFRIKEVLLVLTRSRLRRRRYNDGGLESRCCTFEGRPGTVLDRRVHGERRTDHKCIDHKHIILISLVFVGCTPGLDSDSWSKRLFLSLFLCRMRKCFCTCFCTCFCICCCSYFCSCFCSYVSEQTTNYST